MRHPLLAEAAVELAEQRMAIFLALLPHACDKVFDLFAGIG
jgi:hypothetical protein